MLFHCYSLKLMYPIWVSDTLTVIWKEDSEWSTYDPMLKILSSENPIELATGRQLEDVVCTDL